MSNLNIQQKVSLINQKTKENKVKESNLTDEQQRINDYNENIKPALPEDQSALIQKYHTKLSGLGEYKEVNIYDMVRKYDWNVTVLDDLTSVMIKKWEELGDASGWKEVKRVAKPAVTKKAKEAEDVKRPRRHDGEENDLRDRSRNFKGAQRNFKEKARRGQSMDPIHGGYGRKYDQYEDYDGEGEYQDVRHYKDDRTRRRDRGGQKEIVMYVKKGEQQHQEKEVKETVQGEKHGEKHVEKHGETAAATQTKRKPSEEVVQRKGRFEKVIYVKKNKDAGAEAAPQQETRQDTRQGRGQQEGRGRGRQQGRKEEENEGHGWQNAESLEEKQAQNNNKVQEKENKPVNASATKEQRKDNAATGSAKKEAQAQNAESLSPVRHYNEHNIHEFFMMKDGKESAKKEARREPERTEEVSHPKQKEEKSQTDHVPQAAQKPSADQPIGPNRTQNTQNNQTATQNAAPSPQSTATTQNTTATAQSPHSENFTNVPQYMPQAYGFPQYPQQPYFMPQFPQQPMYNPYMAYMPQTQPQGQQQQQQQQQQGSYPPGFNPQDMSSMFQVQYMLIPQQNGPPILQPIFPMMPQMMGVGMQRPAEGGEQQKYAQPYYQFPVTMPNTPPEFYNSDDKKTRHQGYDNKQTATPNTGAFFNFSNNESEHKKQQQQQQHQGGYIPQQGGYQFMPFMIPTNTAMHPGQQHQGKQNEKSDFLFPNH